MQNDKQSYKYILIDEVFVNVNQRIIKLVFHLYRNGKSFECFERLARVKLPRFLLRAIRILQFTHKFYIIRKKDYRNRLATIVTSKYKGNCLLQLRQGEYKVFDFKHNIVLTAYPNCFSELQIEKVISKTKMLEKCNLVPKLINYNIREKYIIEEYKNMYLSTYDICKIRKYTREISPVIFEIMSISEVEFKNIYSYSVGKIEDINSLQHLKRDDRKYDLAIIKQFLNYSLDKIVEVTGVHKNVSLVFSHGDFWEGNILKKGTKINVIDWNTAGYRSFYFDFYFSMFMLASKRNLFDRIDHGSIIDLNNVLDTSVILLYKNMLRKFQNPNIIPRQFNGYRYLFYIELITLKLEESNIHHSDLEEIFTWIDRFKYLESLKNLP